jgi:hypothetical protein
MSDWGRSSHTSKGADEQSSRRAPGSQVDPGVCFFWRFICCKEVPPWPPVGQRSSAKEDAMRGRMLLALFVATLAVGPASAQIERGGVRTETQDRLASKGSGLTWDLVGLIGLLGLLGLHKRHEEDSYHPSGIE